MNKINNLFKDCMIDIKKRKVLLAHLYWQIIIERIDIKKYHF